MTLTGPVVVDDESSYLDRLGKKMPSLLEWLDSNDDPVVVLTLGSEVMWQQWYVDAFYHGAARLRAKGIRIRCVWALNKGPGKMPKDTDSAVHFVSNWIP